MTEPAIIAPKLTAKQKAFADLYFISGNAKESAIKAGYPAKNAHVEASRSKANPKIQAYLEIKSRALVADRGDQIVALVKGLDKKDLICLETFKAFDAIKDPNNATKFKYWELLCKLKGHLNASEAQNLLFSRDGRNMSVNEILKDSSRISMTLERIKIEAKKYDYSATAEENKSIIDVSPLSTTTS